jgi:protocatechuate 3,4-dioxygenase beta subunit
MVSRWQRNRLARRSDRAHRVVSESRADSFEPLESRLMMSLIGITPSFPVTTYATGTVAYDAGSFHFENDATPLLFRETAVSLPRTVNAPRGFTIDINVDNSGNLIGGVPGDDLVLTGSIDLNGDTIIDVSGTLLTGEILQFGHANSASGTTDNYDFRFKVTGGALAPLYFAGKDIGVTLTSENSTFNGDFSASFTGQAKGNIGAIPQLAALGDFVWEDLDADGQQDADEPGIEGVLVTLTGAGANGTFGDGDDTTQTQLTDADGKYLFTNLTPGNYKVDFDDVAGYVRTSTDTGADDTDSDADATGATGVYTLAAGETNLTVDAGYYRLAALGDFVWHDTDMDGQQDGDEPGIEGVLVTLTGAGANGIFGDSDDITDSQLTNALGGYLFTGLTPGDYKVTFAAVPGHARTTTDTGDDATDSDADASGDTGVYTLSSGQTNLTVDAGYFKLAALGDFVWYDVDGDGLQTDGEPGLQGVEVTLTGAGANGMFGDGDDTTATQFTDADGKYLFTDLLPGQYKVTFGTYLNYVLTTTDTGVNDTLDSDADQSTRMTGVYTLAAGETNLTVDAGLRPPIISPSVPSIDIEKFVQIVTPICYEGLTPGYWKNHAPCKPNQVTAWTPTGYTPGQSYESVFNVNVPGSPTLLQALGANGGGVYALMRHSTAALLNSAHPTIEYKFTTAQVLSMTKAAIDSGDAALIESTKNTLAAQNELGANLSNANGGNCGCYCGPCGVQGSNPTDPDDADTAPGVTVQVGDELLFTYEVRNTGDVGLVNVVVTDDNATPGNTADDFAPAAVLSGAFNIGDLDMDNVLDVGEVWKYTAAGSVTASGSFQNIGSVVGASVEDGTTATDSDPANWSTPLVLTHSLSGNVYVDLDNDGVFDNDETGIEGVKVKLTGTTTSGQSVTLYATTDSSGFYEFTGLLAGTYTVTETQPADYNDGKDTAGSKGGNTSVNDRISAIVLSNGDDSTDNNFGERLGEACLSGYVYNDKDCDGHLDANEEGIAGVTITLTGTTKSGVHVTLTTVTDEDGFYRFDNLLAGNYTITESQPADYNDGKDSVGSFGGNNCYNDKIKDICVPASAVCGVNYNFGEKAKTPPPPPKLVCGMTATIGFWQNKNGQNLIKSLNGGQNATNLGNYLASNYANLFGSLAGKTNAQVASYFSSLFNASGTKLEAQVMAVALATYVTNSTLAGNAAVKYGFVVSASGTGAVGYNVSKYGSVLGLNNYTTYTISEILAAANSKASNGKLFHNDSSKRSSANCIFTDINEDGDISDCGSCGGGYGGGGYGGGWGGNC